MTPLMSFAVWAILAQNTMTNIVLTEADAGSSHDVKRGDTIELRLKENPSTGYRWSIDVEPPGAAAIVGSSQEPGGAGLGAGGTREFIITVNRPGAVTLQAKLWRQWEGESSAVERHSFALRIR